jgi:adenine deaminase
MASINAAVHFRIDQLVGSLSPGCWADVILAGDLQHVVPDYVFVKWQLVAQDNKLAVDIPPADYPEWFSHTVHVTRGKHDRDFVFPADGDTATVQVIELYPDQIINELGQATLRVIDGAVQPDIDQDVLKLAVVERYGKNGNIGISFVKGFNLKRGALASSVAHDHHNIIVVGTNDEDMAVCVRAIEELQGGLAVAADGEVLGTLALSLGGLMSEKPVGEVIEALEHITHISHELGGTLPANP